MRTIAKDNSLFDCHINDQRVTFHRPLSEGKKLEKSTVSCKAIRIFLCGLVKHTCRLVYTEFDVKIVKDGCN